MLKRVVWPTKHKCTTHNPMRIRVENTENPAKKRISSDFPQNDSFMIVFSCFQFDVSFRFSVEMSLMFTLSNFCSPWWACNTQWMSQMVRTSLQATQSTWQLFKRDFHSFPEIIAGERNAFLSSNKNKQQQQCHWGKLMGEKWKTSILALFFFALNGI